MRGVLIMSLFSSFGRPEAMPGAAIGLGAEQRAALRRQLIEARDAFSESPDWGWASAALARHLDAVLVSLNPRCLGGYWPVRSEFNPWQTWPREAALASLQRALPWARREPRGMSYRLWDGSEPHELDGCGIPSSHGADVSPDVLLVPCVGFTRTGWRLGYGGGYFDRYLAAHHDVFTIGVAWACGELPASRFEPQMHDRPLNLVITQDGVLESAPSAEVQFGRPAASWPLSL
ncbi:5-formyltetrahydrofolate cyclo-ligase [Aquabacterium sp.]|uniref:5-formyltetrahydrofolate cyclo-ligase n=1 Tax=Aquabacterium sp. TaxID=1872578 RepID=UPI0035B488CD